MNAFSKITNDEPREPLLAQIEMPWGFRLRPSDMKEKASDLILEWGLTLLGGVLILSAFGQWLLPGALYSGDALMLKFVLTCILGLLGGLALSVAGRGFRPEVQVDRVRQEIRFVSRNPRGRGQILATVDIGQIIGVGITKSVNGPDCHCLTHCLARTVPEYIAVASLEVFPKRFCSGAEMRRISMGTRDELLEAVSARYRGASRAEKGRILTEFAEISGYHRKHVQRLLRRDRVVDRSRPRPKRRIYDEAVREALIVLWETSDRICGKRLKPLIPLLIPVMERNGHLELDEDVRLRLLKISAATIDRVLAPVRAVGSGGKRRRTAHSSAVRRSVPIRTYADWNDPAPGYMEADLVAHSGPSASGSFVQTLTLTDIATGWTECAPLLFREQRLLSEVMTALHPTLPFPLLGFDTDNDSVFMNETIKSWCEAKQVEFTRSRPYRKNDQAHVEQKNGAIVRRMVGYRRYTGIAAATELARLYRSMRLYVNFFQPSFKLMEKTRDGARVTKRYHPPLTPFQRVQAHPAVAQAAKNDLAAQFAQLDPVVLLHDIRQSQERLTALADATPPAESESSPKEDVGAFLDGLRHAWREGEVRPTSRKKPTAPRCRRRPDPLADVTDDLKSWFDEDPSKTGRELLSRLQATYPEAYPDALLRTVQRRLRTWRGDMARALVFSGDRDKRPMMTSDPLRDVEASRVRGHQETSTPESSPIENPREHPAEATAGSVGNIFA